ncbi:MAG: hypothetical protein P0S95_08270 [Rhabdochlamydiaceae bacterium]|nr:hypothetical protein [Candidatus Amphrikana amoebophyrae]
MSVQPPNNSAQATNISPSGQLPDFEQNANWSKGAQQVVNQLNTVVADLNNNDYSSASFNIKNMLYDLYMPKGTSSEMQKAFGSLLTDVEYINEGVHMPNIIEQGLNQLYGVLPEYNP